MPIYLHILNLIVPKDIAAKKYKGGIEAFRIWFNEKTGTRSQEDNDVFSIARMGWCRADIDDLVESGLEYDEETQRSDDFAIVCSHMKKPWTVDWLEDNTIFAWHKDCKPEHIALAKKIASTNIEEITEAYEKRGEVLLDTIK